MVVNKVKEYIFPNGIKVQMWKCGNGYDIVLMENGHVKSTLFAVDKADEIYNNSIVYIEEKLKIGANVWE